MIYSLNDKLIVETYKTDGSIKLEVKNGFAFVQQKTAIKGLKVLVSTSLSTGDTVPVGSMVYIKEEDLHNKDWAKKTFTSDVLSEPFMIVELRDVQFIKEAK